MADTDSVLRFDRADYAGAQPASPPCAVCRGSLGTEYWKWQRLVFCTGCRPKITTKLAESQSVRTTVRAGLLGGGVALLCGVGYAVFVAVTNMQLALVTIGIAYVVGRVIRKASGGVGGLRFQILAVVLTYVASTMGYAPGILRAVSAEANEKSQTADVASAHESSAPGDPGGPAASPPRSQDAGKPSFSLSSLGALVYVFAVLFRIMLEAPFLELSAAPLGVVIVAIGLWQAWKLTRGVPLEVEGPYRLVAAPQATGA
jgi:hypothetical protein